MNTMIDDYVIDIIALVRGAEDSDVPEIEALVRSKLISFIDACDRTGPVMDMRSPMDWWGK
jgi:hypothetical protein